MSSEKYIAIQTQLGLKRILKLSAKKDGTVLVTFSPAPKFSSAESIEQLLRLGAESFVSAERNSKISLHSTRGSGTLNRVNQGLHVEAVFTEAIKKTFKFQFVQLRVLGDLASSRHDLSTSKIPIEVITQLDTSKDTIVVGIVLGPKAFNFQKIEDHPSNLHSFEFKDFKVWVIWSMFNWPARPVGINFEYFGGTLSEPAQGLENWEIYNTYSSIKQIFTDGYFAVFGDSRAATGGSIETHFD